MASIELIVCFGIGLDLVRSEGLRPGIRPYIEQRAHVSHSASELPEVNGVVARDMVEVRKRILQLGKFPTRNKLNCVQYITFAV